MDTSVLEHLEIAKHFNLSDQFFHVVPPEYTKKLGFPVLLRNIKWVHKPKRGQLKTKAVHVEFHSKINYKV